MTKPTFPRSHASHEAKACEILERHYVATRKVVQLPVPIEAIVESTFGLKLLHDEIDEPQGEMILGALDPVSRTIILNERHENLFVEVIGPERFTVAHELSHWVYDAENPDQTALDFSPLEDIFCYHSESPLAATEAVRVREMNANKLAAALLLPERCLKAINIEEVLAQIDFYAASWGVSRQTLNIRLKQLELIDPQSGPGLPLWG